MICRPWPNVCEEKVHLLSKYGVFRRDTETSLESLLIKNFSQLGNWIVGPRATLDDIKANRRPEWESVEPAFWATTLATQQIASYSTQNRPYLAVDLDGRQAHFLTESELTTENLNHAIALFDLRQPDKTSVAHREFIQERLLAGGRKEAVKRLASVIDTVVFIP